MLIVDHMFCNSTPPPVTTMKDDGASQSWPVLERVNEWCKERGDPVVSVWLLASKRVLHQ